MTDPSFFDATMFRQLAGVYGDIFAFDLQRYLIGAGGVFLLINVMLKRWLRGRKIRNKTPGGAQMRREAMISVRTVAIIRAERASHLRASRGWRHSHPVWTHLPMGGDILSFRSSH